MTKGERIKAARKAKGVTQEELAKACKTIKQTIYKYENNIITNIPSDKIELMATFLGVSEAYIMGWSEAPALDSVVTDQNILIEISKKLDTQKSARLLEYAKALLVTQEAEKEAEGK